ncbi:DUF58 domain-containing protein [Brachybacterium muris]|uniref:DUF58 domain-containing protein n=1 Tax=Brachybacterium muris TaxID=219301 RepID=UPI00223B30B9|nr:DUF58 domain-containing protein [Brachybacterium muris]
MTNHHSPLPGTVVRPTGRAIVVLVCAVALWILADLTRVMPARVLAAALLLTLAIGAASIALSLVGLGVRRQVVDDVVPAGSRSRIQVDLAPGALIGVMPLGRAVIREDLPAALGGRGDLPLGARMPHALTVSRRGTHLLGPLHIVVQDMFGMFHLRRTIEDGARIVGLPVAEEIGSAAARATGIAHEQQQSAVPAPGIGEIGPIARPYAAGDDIRRIHWRASARTGNLMTREDEPPAGRSALIVLDNRRHHSPDPDAAPPDALVAAEDRLLDHAASVLASLRAHGWEVRVVDADGDEITRAERHRGQLGASLLGREADAVGERASLLALADVGFDDDSRPAFHALPGAEHATGHPQMVVALGTDDGDPFADLELDRFAGRARHRTAIALVPEQAGSEPTATTSADGWTLVRGSTRHQLGDLLTAAAPGSER